jgi:TRAP transporter 4TM/12TM fusion protein
LVMFAYLFLGHNLPGILNHQPLSFSDIIEMSFSLNGVFGIALATVTNTIAIFIIMGSVLLLTGMGDLFSDLSLICTGRFVGGPAQASIVAATLFGSINGSGPACVMSVGSFTIPLMIRSGYTPTYAGALCATASCVGQIMPPVMGIGAFLMAEITGIPYSKIMIFALVPALLYSLSLMINARFEALRLNLSPLKKDQCPKFEWKLFPRVILLAITISVLLWQILSGFAVNMSGFRTVIVLLVGSLLIKEIRPDFRKFVEMFISGGRDLLSLTIICAAIGIVIGGLGITGLGFRFSQAIIIMAKSNLLLALVMTAICCIILGMGLPTAASYLIVVFVALPSLTKLGFPVLDTHMFVFYYAVLSTITPPVALNAYAAASIAKSSPLEIGFVAMRLGMVGFILPFLWISSSALIIGNAPFTITLLEFIVSIFFVIFMSAANSGYLYQKLNIFERFTFGVAGIVLVFTPYRIVRVGGALLAILVLLLFKKRAVKKTNFGVWL